MASIYSTGIGSGLDVNAIVTQLMSIERRPLTLLQSAESALNTQMSAFGTLQSKFSALKDAAASLTSLTLWNQTTAASANTSAVKVSTGSGAVAGSYAVQVDALASTQTVSSSAFSGSDALVGEGTLTIELGSWTGEPAPTGFTAKSGSSPLVLTIGPEETSLAAIRDKINAAGAGISASIINDASGARLALRSSETGAENAFRITASEAVDDGNLATGLSALGYDATAASPMTRSQTAANASASINGITVTSASNTLSEVADGLTLTLSQVTTEPVDITVAADSEAVRSAITSFVSAFNGVASYIREQTKYDEATKTGGTLQGDRIVTTLQSQLRSLFNQESTASSVFARMSDIGIAFKADGTLETKTSKLDNALENLPELQKLLAADGSDLGTSGFVDRIKDFAAAALGSEGSFETRNDSIKRQLDTNQTRQDAMEQRLGQTEARLLKQYQALDSSMSTLTGLSNYLTQQLAALNASSR
jgi:flagellar hook-associated protein 2